MPDRMSGMYPRFEYESTIYHLSNAHRWPPSRPHLPVSRRNGCPTEFELYLKNDTLDVVLGTSEWRGKIIEELKKHPTLMETSKCPGATRIVFEAFKGQLTKLGYPHIAAGDEIRFKNSKRAQLYYLITSFSRRDIKRGMNFGKRFKLSYRRSWPAPDVYMSNSVARIINTVLVTYKTRSLRNSLARNFVIPKLLKFRSD